MNRKQALLAIVALLPMAVWTFVPSVDAGGVAAQAKSDAVLTAGEVGSNLFPEKVFFGGQVATVQMRNAGGVRFSDGAYALAALVDGSGYSTELRQKYQGYFLIQAALEIQGQKLPAGAYGFGFLAGGKFVVMDLGARELFVASSAQDAALKRPVPLQVAATSPSGAYRLYAGRDYIEFKRAQ